MTNNVILAGEFSNNMVEIVENLIVKVGKKEQLIFNIDNKSAAISDKITGKTISDWKMYTLKYFKFSSSAFLQQDPFY